MKKAFKIVLIVCAAIFVVGLALFAVSLFTGGGWDAIQNHGNLTGLVDRLSPTLPFIKNLF